MARGNRRPRLAARGASARRAGLLALPQIFGFLLLASLLLLPMPFLPGSLSGATGPKEATAGSSGRVELVERRTRTSKTFSNDEGTLTTVLSPGAVHYRAEGKWEEIQSEFVPAEAPGYAFRNRANSFRASFKENAGEGFLRMEVRDQAFEFSLPEGRGQAARARGANLGYRDVFPGADLRYELLPDGVKETVVLQTVNAPTRYRFLLTPPQDTEVQLEPQPDGSIAVLSTPYDGPAFVLLAPVVSDGSGVIESRSDIVSMKASREGDRFAIDLTLDPAWLRAPEREFPVLLDPTLVIEPPVQNGSWNQTCDTCKLVQGTRLSIGSSDTQTWRAGLLFDVGALPVGANVSDAQLKLYYDQTCLKSPCGGSHQLDVHRISTYWSTAATTQSIGFASPALASFTLADGAAAQWMSWNVTDAVKRWHVEDDPNFGLLLKRSSEALGSNGPMPPSAGYTGDTTLKPKLEVTYVDDGLELPPPTTIHSDGAELRWTPYADPNGAAFERYEVHRSPSAGFTPSAATLLATIGDPSATAFRDTTAAPGKTFTYKVVANGAAATTERTTTLPADGQATKELRPFPATYIVFNKNVTSCGNYGSFYHLRVGADTVYLRRPLLQFDFRDVPSGATVTNATLGLFTHTTISNALSVSAHRATSAWREGTSGNGSCTGDGATWYETEGGVKWGAAGGDFDQAKEATRSIPAGEDPTWHDFAITSLVQRWVSGQAPNLGVLLKLDDETMTAGRWFSYLADDYTVAKTQRPKLTVTYADGSHAQGPSVSIASPGPGELVRGTAVRIAAAASDDRRVDSVVFFVDGSPVGTDTSEPFAVDWNSTSVAHGEHSLTAKATDDAGNEATSSAVTVTVENSAPPATSVTSMVASYPAEVREDQPGGYWRLGDPLGATVAADASGNLADGSYEDADLGAAGALANDPDPAVGFAPGAAGSSPPSTGPASNSFAGAGELVGRTGTTSGSNVGATKETGEPNHAGNAGGKSVWWKWTATAGGTVTIDTAGSSFDTLLAVYTGSAVNALTSIVSNDDVSNKVLTSKVSFTAVAGTTYRIAVDGYGGASGSITLNWSQSSAPPNNNFAAAQTITGTSGGVVGDNVGATKESGEPSHGGNAGGKSIWNSWTAPASASVTIDTIGSNFDTLLGVYTGSAVNALTTIAGDDDSGSNLKSKVTFNAVKDTVYRIAVDGYGGASGSITLNWTMARAPGVNLGDRFDFGGTAPFTLEAWVKPSTIDAVARRIFSKEVTDGAGRQGYALSVSTSGLTFERARDGAADSVTYATGLAANAWSHVVATYDGGTMALYVNGQLAASASGKTRLLVDHASALRLARNASASADFFAGAIDEAAVYPAAVTASRVASHYDAGRAQPTTIARRTVRLNADASDDRGVTKVEFYVDQIRVGEDSVAPYSVEWSTLDPAQPFYDGSHVVTTRAYDAGGQVTTSADFGITVDNAGAASEYHATFSSTAFPTAVVYDPAAEAQDKHGLDVTVTNAGQTAWSAGDVVLRYRWVSPDPAPVYTDGSELSLGSDVGAGASTTVRVLAGPPALPDGVNKAQYQLRVDLYEKSTGKWFAVEGNKPLENPVTVNKALLQDALGLERYYHYVGEELGAGMQHLVNVASGNSLVRFTPFLAPGRGLSTVVDLTYNSLEKRCSCPEGHNWALSISSLSAFGRPLDVHPNKADEIAGNAKRYIDLVDGDGTTHRFTSSDGVVWEEPAGVHLYLRKYSDTDAQRKWALTRPDRVTFFYDAEGFPTFALDKNANELSFVYESVAPGEDPQGPRKRITTVTDAGGRSFTLSYYSKAEAKRAHVRGKLKTIADHTGSTLRFDYYEDGNLLRITQVGGTKADGSFLADRTWVFAYTTPSGSGPAISDVNARKNPDPRTSAQSTRIYGVIDPRGSETVFTYLGPGDGVNRWKLESVTNRAGERTELAYDTANRVTTVTAPLSRVSSYAYDVEGKVTTITNPKGEATQVGWSGDRHVAKVTEPGGAYTEFAYNQNGYLTDEEVLTDRKDPAVTTDDVVAHTKLVYEDIAVDGNNATKHISQLVKKTDPKGVATTDVAADFEWLFAYDAVGNLTTVTDPEGFAETYAYNPDGTQTSSTDPLNRTTTFVAYDANGLPIEIRDPKGQLTRFGYDADGLLRWLQDPLHAADGGTEEREYKAFFDYDSFHRLGRQSAPKSTRFARGTLIWSSADYDPNDNVAVEFAPDYGDEHSGAKTTTQYDAMDRPTLITGPDTSADLAGERTRLEYDGAGRLKRVTAPKGVLSADVADDFVTQFEYDLLDRVVTDARLSGGAEVLRAHFCYDTAGDLRWVTQPKAGLTAAPTDCPTGTPSSHTARLVYDDAHRPVSQTDPLGRSRSLAYDLNSDVVSETDEDETKVTRTYNQRGELVKVVEPFEKDGSGAVTRSLTTKLEYDAAGNLKREISPRAFDASADKVTFSDYVTEYVYDELDRLVRFDLPMKGAEARTYLHRGYDPNGNVTLTTLPSDKVDPALVRPEDRTTVDYFDTGWIRTSNDPANPAVHFDYSARGEQASRTPEVRGAPGDLDEGQQILWSYYADGQLQRVTDARGIGFTVYTYDANGNLTKADEGKGRVTTDEPAIDVESSYDAFDRVSKVRHQKRGSANWVFTKYGYDANGNVVLREDNGEEALDGSLAKAARRNEFSYDQADQLQTQFDLGTEPGATDDQRITSTYFATGWRQSQSIEDGDGSGGWTLRQRGDWTYFANGLLKSQTTTNDSGTTLESHTLHYEDLSGVYLNGHATRDVFRLLGPDTNAPCRTADCASAYAYDARERLVQVKLERAGTTTVTDYALDPAGNVLTESLNGVEQRRFEYDGRQLTKLTAEAMVSNYFYDSEGNLDCITTGAGISDDCKTAEGAAISSNLLARYVYDPLNRLKSTRSYNTGALTDSADYVADALDRVAWQTETHGTATRKTTFNYLGLSGAVSEELHETGSGPVTKRYGYDAFEQRTGMTRTSGAITERYSYGRNVHGDISLLIDQAGSAKAAYGYTPYGDEDAQLTRGDALKPDGKDPLNPYRFNDRRYDTGSGSIDMGARRFGPDIGRFLQKDLYVHALDDLDLAADPLTQNRYAFAAGNPVSFVETDGHAFAHFVIGDGGGGGRGVPIIDLPPGFGEPGAQETDDLEWIIGVGGLAKKGILGGLKRLLKRGKDKAKRVAGRVPRSRLEALALIAGLRDPSKAVAILAREVEQKGIEYLKRRWMRPGERRAYTRNPAEGGRFVGTAMHRAVTATLERLFPGRFVSNRAVLQGTRLRPDFFDTRTGRIIDLTTPGEVRRHVSRYLPIVRRWFLDVDIVVYRRPG
jgi:RHS repeat-associated protein